MGSNFCFDPSFARSAANANLSRRSARSLGTPIAKADSLRALPLSPGFVFYTVLLPLGPARNAFAVLTGLLPGTVPIPSDEGNMFAVHCLDISQPVHSQLGEEEMLLQKGLGLVINDG